MVVGLLVVELTLVKCHRRLVVRPGANNEIPNPSWCFQNKWWWWWYASQITPLNVWPNLNFVQGSNPLHALVTTYMFGCSGTDVLPRNEGWGKPWAMIEPYRKNLILSRLEIVLPLLKVLLKRRRSDEKKWISTVPSIGPREKKIFLNFF